MALGDMGRALRIMSLAQGWDPNIIPAKDGKPEVNIGNFNKNPERPGDGDHCVGKLPEGTLDSYPQAEEPRYDERISFNSPELRENKNNKGGGKDPYAGMGGM
jgi:hypothetical protein